MTADANCLSEILLQNERIRTVGVCHPCAVFPLITEPHYVKTSNEDHGSPWL